MAISLANAQEYLKLLALGSQFPDFNASFVPPRLTDPNYVPPFNGQGVNQVGFTLAAIAIIIVGIRVYARAIEKSSKWGLDDWLIIPGLLITNAITILVYIHYHPYGLGHHSYDLSWNQITALYKLAFIHHILYLYGTTCIRLSLLAFYSRLLPDPRSRTRKVIIVLAILTSLFTVVGQFSLVFAHKPARAAWDANARLNKNYHALKVWVIVTILSSLFCLVDFIIWLLPLTIVWTLSMSLRRRLGLSVLFGFGGIACIALIVRTTLINRLYNSFDSTWDAGSVALCNQIECYIAIIAASLPAVNGWYRSNVLGYQQTVQSASKSKITSLYKKVTARSSTLPTQAMDKSTDDTATLKPDIHVITEEDEGVEGREKDVITVTNDISTSSTPVSAPKRPFYRFLQSHKDKDVNLSTWGVSKSTSQYSVDLPIQSNRTHSEIDMSKRFSTISQTDRSS